MMTWRNPNTQKWECNDQAAEGIPQIAELATAIRAFKKFKQLCNLVTDLVYVARIAERAEHSLLKEMSNQKLFNLLSKLIHLISH